jgi:iodotyrosine deiodinase
MEEPVFVPFEDRYRPTGSPELEARQLHQILARRRSIRMFSSRPVSRQTIECLVQCACSAPSGANKQPWRFVAVQDSALKAAIRQGAEAEERELYSHRASAEWLRDLAPLGTDQHKQYLEIAPWLMVVFKMTRSDSGGKVYYADESVGIATGMLLAAAQVAGLSTLTHTPSPMAFLGEILSRPKHEKPYMLIPIGYPADDCTVPLHAMQRRPLAESLIFDRSPHA